MHSNMSKPMSIAIMKKTIMVAQVKGTSQQGQAITKSATAHLAQTNRSK